MIALFFIIWIILNGRVTPEIVLFGAVFAALMSLFAHKVLGYSWDSDKSFFRNFPLYLKYVVVLLIEIIKAAFSVMKIALSGNPKPDPIVIEFNSGLKKDAQNVLLANSITLTPGTYTLFQEGDHFVVHCLIREFAEGMEDSSFIQILKKMK